MLEHLIAGEQRRWTESWRAALRAIQARLKLWDAIAATLPH